MEPILEKYRSRPIVVDRKATEGIVKEAGILEDYSAKYLLVRQVMIKVNEKEYFIEKTGQKPKFYDVLYSRSSTIIRNTLSS